MHENCVVAEFDSIAKARTALEVLSLRNFTQDSVSVITLDNVEGLQEIEQSLEQRKAETTVSEGAGIGALVGGGLVAPLAIGSLVANFFIAGPLAAMVAGAAAGGAMSGARSWNMPDRAAASYQERLERGAILIVVHAEDEDDFIEAESGLRTVGPISLERFAIDFSHGDSSDATTE